MTEEKRPLGRPRYKWVDNGSFRDRMGWCGLDWIGTRGGLINIGSKKCCKVLE
jgi:hypothetical protein